VICTICLARGPLGKSPEEAIALWNQPPAPTKVDLVSRKDVLRAMKKARSDYQKSSRGDTPYSIFLRQRIDALKGVSV
jgi:hypothetical protein